MEVYLLTSAFHILTYTRDLHAAATEHNHTMCELQDPDHLFVISGTHLVKIRPFLTRHRKHVYQL